MVVTDLNLYMRFARRPRVIGTFCYYAPENAMLATPGLGHGAKLFIVGYPEEGIFVTVVSAAGRERKNKKGNYENLEPYEAERLKQKIPEEGQYLVLWKDLVQ